MTATKIVKCLLIAALLACATAKAAEQTIVIALDEGNEVISFKVGDLDCVVKESQIRCTK
jgi:hypothetical protein